MRKNITKRTTKYLLNTTDTDSVFIKLKCICMRVKKKITQRELGIKIRSS